MLQARVVNASTLYQGKDQRDVSNPPISVIIRRSIP